MITLKKIHTVGSLCFQQLIIVVRILQPRSHLFHRLSLANQKKHLHRMRKSKAWNTAQLLLGAPNVAPKQQLGGFLVYWQRSLTTEHWGSDKRKGREDEEGHMLGKGGKMVYRHQSTHPENQRTTQS